MKKAVKPLKSVLVLVFLCHLSGCASFSELDQDLIQHPAMDLKKNITFKPQTPLTQLGNAEGAQGGGCSSCAR